LYCCIPLLKNLIEKVFDKYLYNNKIYNETGKLGNWETGKLGHWKKSQTWKNRFIVIHKFMMNQVHELVVKSRQELSHYFMLISSHGISPNIRK